MLGLDAAQFPAFKKTDAWTNVCCADTVSEKLSAAAKKISEKMAQFSASVRSLLSRDRAPKPAAKAAAFRSRLARIVREMAELEEMIESA
jgi:hypothetical protein